MMVHNPQLSEEYYVSSFISGLGDEIRPMVKMMPSHGETSCESARLQEMIVDAMTKKQRNQTKGVFIGG